MPHAGYRDPDARAGSGFSALNPETGSATQGETVEEAIANLREAVTLDREEFPLKLAGAPLVTTFTIAEHA